MSAADDRVAVVGMGCRFPGRVSSPAAFWEMLRDGRDTVGPMPEDRFDVRRFLDPTPRTPGKMVAAEGGFLRDVDRFDAAFFGISPREAAKMDPQQRLLLEVVWEALEDAGIPPSAIAGRRTGVYVGLWSGEYENVIYRVPEELDFHALTGGGRYAASGRISWAFDFRGPCVTVDSGCSASLSALHMARRAIVDGEIDVAIVGAANLILQPHVSIGYSRSGMLSPGARCRFGDADAVGYVRSEGVAAVVLERLDRADTEGDPIRALILDSAVNADGRGSGQLATPSMEAQAELLETVWMRSAVSADRVPYVEAHGTGTRVGDPVELGALGSVLGMGRAPDRPLMVGSVKSNMGHTEACAGMAGLFKTVLAIEHGVIPANLHLQTPNPEVEWSELGIAIPTDATPWPADSPRIAGVSSFGITGTNAHAVVAAREETRLPEEQHDGSRGAMVWRDPDAGGERTYPIAISAASEEALAERIEQLRSALAGDDAPDLQDVSYTTTCRREHLAHRVVLVAESAGDVVAALDEFLATGAAPRLVQGVTPAASPPRIAFVFSGQGSQWMGMARDLLGSAPAFTEAIEKCDRALAAFVDFSIVSVLEGRGPDLEAVDVIQPTLVSVQIALARLLEASGISADGVVGHSMGEVAAAHIAGALSLEDAMRVIATRSRLLAGIAGRGAMGLIDLGRDEVEARLESWTGRLSIAALNGPRSTVVSGDPEALDALLATLESEDVFCRRVRVDVASHSPQCDPLVPPLLEALNWLAPTPPEIPFHSTPLAAEVSESPLDADYWAGNLRGAVRLDETVRGMIEAGFDTFVEVSPHPILLSSLADIAADRGTRVNAVGLLRREESERERMLDALARLHVSGAAVDWMVHAPRTARPVRLPAYPWQRARYWLENWEDWSGSGASPSLASWPDEARAWLHAWEWEPVSLPAAQSAAESAAAESWVLLADPSPLADAVSAALPASRRVAPGDLNEAFPTADRGPKASAPAGVIVLEADGGSDDPHAAAVTGCDTVRRLVQTLASRDQAPPRLILATRGARSCDPGSRVDAAGAALWGFGRALREEQPELGVRLLDLDPDAEPSESADALVSALSAATLDQDVARRGGTWFTPRLARVDVPRAERGPWPSRGATLITGGLGDLGLTLARQLAGMDAGPLVLLSRTPLPPRSEWADLRPETKVGARVAAVRELEAMGASVETRAVDVGDAESLDAFLREWRAEARPEIVAVIHAAGVLDSHLVRDLPEDALRRVFAGKVRGAFALDRAFPKAERFILFSSTSAVMPHPGEANYAAANAVLDALAEDRRGRGLEGQAVNWGVWRDSGLIADGHGARYVEELGRQGIGTMAPETAVRVFERIAAAGLTRSFVAAIDWERYAESRSQSRIDPLFRDMTGEATPESDSLRARLDGLDGDERLDAIREVLRELAGRVLGVGTSGVRQGATFGAQGMDSLMAMEFRNHLEGAFRVGVSATIAWNYPTLDLLAGHLSGRLRDTSPGEARTSLPSRDTAPVEAPAEQDSAEQDSAGDLARHAQEVAGLSDAEALRELLGDR